MSESGNGNKGGVFGNTTGDFFTPPNFSPGLGFGSAGFGTGSIPTGFAFNQFDFGAPFGSPEGAAGGLRSLFTNPAPFLQEIVGHLDEKMVEEAIRKSMGEAGSGFPAPVSAAGGKSFKETVTVDKSGSGSGERGKYRVEIALGEDAQPESLKISRKDRVMTIEVKTEKSSKTQDGSSSSRLYQEYTKVITLPENVDLTQLQSVLSPQGVLSIQAPLTPKPEEANKPSAPIPSTQIPVIIEDDEEAKSP